MTKELAELLARAEGVLAPRNPAARPCRRARPTPRSPFAGSAANGITALRPVRAPPHHARRHPGRGRAGRRESTATPASSSPAGAANNCAPHGRARHRQALADQAPAQQIRRARLRLIEVDKTDLVDLPEIVELVAGRPDASSSSATTFPSGWAKTPARPEEGVLDGSVSAMSDNVLIYATSNRRHLMPEYRRRESAGPPCRWRAAPGEAVEEKISLSRALRPVDLLHPFSQDEYLDIVAHWLQLRGER